MGKNIKSRLMPFFITLILLASMLVFLPSGNVVKATSITLSNDGAGDIPLTCGDELTIKVTDGSLDPNTNYYVAVKNVSGNWIRLCSSKSADDYGDIELTFKVPGWNDVDGNPTVNHSAGLSTAGTWNVSIINASSGNPVTGAYDIITISNLYDVYFKYNGETIDHVLYNKGYNSTWFEVYVRNWTGYNTGWDDPERDEDFYVDVYDSGWNQLYNHYHLGGSEKWQWTLAASDTDYKDTSTTPDDLETYLIFNVTGGNNFNSSIRLPILLNVSANVPDGAVWGDTLSVSGYVKDGRGNAISGYNVSVYAPDANGNYIPVYWVDTYSNGAFSMSIDTGTGNTRGCAGTWYVGTYIDSDFPRVNVSDDQPKVAGFIPYASFEVATKNEAKVQLETADEITTGFPQTINISVYNSSWMNSNTMYRNMKIHITGVDNYNASSGETFDKDDIVLMNAAVTKYTDKKAYYEFTWTFNETGTVTIWVSYPENISRVARSSTVNNYYDSYYDDKTGLLPNVTGSTTFTVVSAGDMNIEVNNMPTSVDIDDSSPACSSCDNGGRINHTFNVTIVIYGDTANSYKNATITISGCGIDKTIREDDPNAESDAGQTGKGRYWVKISPKTAGTITITATNSSDNLTVSKDYTITGLTGSATTSVGGDKKISAGSTEKITVTVNNGQYADVRLTYYDKTWSSCKCLNETVGDNTEGNGLNGIYEFMPDADDLENVGWIVATASAGSQYMYDIIEVEPIHDLTVNVTTPGPGNQTLTVGLPQDIIVEVKDSNGNYVTKNTPQVTGYLIYKDYTKDNTPYTITFSNYGTGTFKASVNENGGDGWLPFAGQLLIEVVNDSGAQEHDGNITLDVDYATVTYSPGGATAGIDQENLTVAVTVTDANGNPVANKDIWVYVENNTDDSGAKTGFMFKSGDPDYVKVSLDEDGTGEFDIRKVGDTKTWINASLQQHDPSDGENTTSGKFEINYPTFIVNPDTIYIGQSNMVTVTAKDWNGNPIPGVNITFVSSVPGILTAQPDPVQTDSNGQVTMSLQPLASGKLNVTIARNIHYENGQLNWTNAVITDATVTVTSLKTLKISVSQTPIYEGQTLTVTVTSGGSPVSNANVEFAGVTEQTDTNGQASFTVPDPGVESATYTVTVEKTGYVSAEKSITVIKVYKITIIGPSKSPSAGETFTITVIAKGSPLAGATVTFNDKTYTSDGEGKVTLTAPDVKEDTTYTITATFENYEDGTLTITIKPGGGGVPGFEMIAFLAALGVAFILIKRRR